MVGVGIEKIADLQFCIMMTEIMIEVRWVGGGWI